MNKRGREGRESKYNTHNNTKHTTLVSDVMKNKQKTQRQSLLYWQKKLIAILLLMYLDYHTTSFLSPP
jgi:hypothetical protein